MDKAMLWELATDSAEKVAIIAVQLSGKEAQNLSFFRWKMPVVKRLGELASYLLRVSLVHEKHGAQSQNIAHERVDEFLEALEQLCTFDWPPKAVLDFRLEEGSFLRFPILNALKLWLPGQESILVEKITGSLKAFLSGDLMASNRRTRPGQDKPKNWVKNYFAFLETFLSSKNEFETQVQEAHAVITARSAKDVEAPDDFPAHVYETFYKTLKKYSQCCCDPSGAQLGALQHQGKLLLKEKAQIKDDDVIFDTVFSRAPQRLSAGDVEWQHLRFHISVKQNVKHVGFSESVVPEGPEGSDTPPQHSPKAAVQYTGAIKSASHFCDLIEKRVGPAKICLKPRAGKILQLRDPAGIDDDIAPKQTIPLAEVLQRHDLVDKRKLLLAYTLARSFWQFYNSDWMGSRWTTHSLQFFPERRDEDDDEHHENDRILYGSPYFALSTQKEDSLLSAEFLETQAVVHRYPRVLALGIMLLEIGRRRRRHGRNEALQPRHGSCDSDAATPEEKISTDLNEIRSALRRGTWPKFDIQEEVRQTYKIVLENCSDPKLFEPDAANQSGENGMLTVEERRAIIYKRVVYPLKLLLEKLGWIDQAGNIKDQDEEGGSSFADNGDGVTVFRKPAAFLGDNDLYSPAQPQIKAQRWLQRIQESEVTRVLFTGFKANRSLERIRIAVLDTGYDPETAFFSTPDRERRIKGWKDMVVDSSTTRQDEDGHGTYVLSLLMKVAPAADFYIARVARNTDDLANSTENVAQAITWAATAHRVDIISMSFGFAHEIHVNDTLLISNAITNALSTRNQRILFFAAAANGGGNQPVMFPANNEHVISVRGTDDRGWLERFNPPRGYIGIDGVMTLGQDVPGAALSGRGGAGEVCRSGTSVSTPIAAGIAAMLLGYARLYEGELGEYCRDAARLSDLSRARGMRRLLKKMSTEMLEKWFYLSAEEFLSQPHKARLAWLVS